MRKASTLNFSRREIWLLQSMFSMARARGDFAGHDPVLIEDFKRKIDRRVIAMTGKYV